MGRFKNESGQAGDVVALTMAVVLCGLLIIVLLFALSFGVKSYSRYQKRQDAINNVKVTAINIRNAQQQAKVVAANDARIQALADQRVIQAEGIRKAQDKIAKTLTPLYVQHEAIEAQLAMADKPNDTQVFIPVGPQGIPIVKTTP